MLCYEPAQPARVMVVEDDSATRLLFCQAIQSESSLRLSASCSSVTEALDWLKANQCDLLLTDLGLPDGSGIVIIEACRRLHPDTDIMVTTGSSDEEQVLACIEAGACGYVLKESGYSDVVRALLEVRRGGSPISPVIARKVLTRMRRPLRRCEPGEVEALARRLTRREAAILELIARGSSYAKVAVALGLSLGTVQTHIKHIYAKLSVHSRGEAVYEARRHGLLSGYAPPAALTDITLPNK
ncbi:MAG: response regulator [Oxalobacteraceae bacterium]